MEYPTVLKRVQSTLADQIIAFTLIGLLIVSANQINEESVNLKIFAILIGASYEPLMTYKFRTIGQILTGIRVQFTDKKTPLKIVNLYIRFVIKLLLGWMSLFSIVFNKQRRAIHDRLSGTIVVYNKQAKTSQSDKTPQAY